MLSKISYKQVLKGLERCKKQHGQDRQENPNAIPIDWKSSLIRMIETIVRENHERFDKDTGLQTLEYLVNQRLLIRYHGGYTFPNTIIPTIKEIQDQALKEFKKLRGYSQ